MPALCRRSRSFSSFAQRIGRSPTVPSPKHKAEASTRMGSVQGPAKTLHCRSWGNASTRCSPGQLEIYTVRSQQPRFRRLQDPNLHENHLKMFRAERFPRPKAANRDALGPLLHGPKTKTIPTNPNKRARGHQSRQSRFDALLIPIEFVEGFQIELKPPSIE